MSLTRIERRRGQQLTTRWVIGIYLVLLVFTAWIGASLWAYFNLPASGVYSYGQSAATRQALGDYTSFTDLRSSIMNQLAGEGERIYEARWVITSILAIFIIGTGLFWLTINKPSKNEFELS